MRIKNVRKTRAKSPTGGAQAKRQRRQPPSSGIGVEVHSNKPDDPQEPSPVPVSDTLGAIQPETWSMILARIADQPFTSQVQKYKDWRRAGSTHDEQCCICHKPDILEPCHTCNLAFHAQCLPPGWARSSYNQLYCSICVARGWNHSPPVLTPPASPPPSQLQLPATVQTPNAYSNAPRAWDLPAQTPVQEAPAKELEALPAHQNSTHGVQAVEAAGYNPTNVPRDHPASSRIATDTPEPKRRERKSRYSTLAGDVDLSLATIYRELESVASLRAQIADLVSKNIQLTQSIRIHEQNQIATHRVLDALRAKTMTSESASKEISDLREKNASLEAELQISRDQTAAAKELKERLAQLLSN